MSHIGAKQHVFQGNKIYTFKTHLFFIKTSTKEYQYFFEQH